MSRYVLTLTATKEMHDIDFVQWLRDECERMRRERVEVLDLLDAMDEANRAGEQGGDDDWSKRREAQSDVIDEAQRRYKERHLLVEVHEEPVPAGGRRR